MDQHLDSTAVDSPHRLVIDAIEDWDPVDGPLRWPDETFQRLAAAVFRHQYTHVTPYRTLCERRGITPEDEPPPEVLPAVPTDAFKQAELFAGGARSHTFRTSGTTADGRGQHHFRTLDVYRASLHPAFVRFCLPGKRPLRMLVIAPSPADLPDSSLSFMLGALLERHGDADSEYFVSLDDDGQWNIRIETLRRALDEACDDGVPVMLLGTAFGFAECFDRLDNSWTLPPGSRLMETGGFKGRHKTLSRAQLYDGFSTRLGLDRTQCVSEYSMTELSSQTYTDQLANGEAATGRFYAPPWLDIQIADPLSLEPIDTPGATGLIRFVDLANVDSVLAVQTSDRGILHPDGGLELLGRAPQAQLRGCSLTIEEIVEES